MVMDNVRMMSNNFDGMQVRGIGNRFISCRSSTYYSHIIDLFKFTDFRISAQFRNVSLDNIEGVGISAAYGQHLLIQSVSLNRTSGNGFSIDEVADVFVSDISIENSNMNGIYVSGGAVVNAHALSMKNIASHGLRIIHSSELFNDVHISSVFMTNVYRSIYVKGAHDLTVMDVDVAYIANMGLVLQGEVQTLR